MVPKKSTDEILESLPPKKQVVAGFVIFRRTVDGIKYLLLYKRGAYWNFPKGHFKPGERSIDTALRELEEETGIKKNDLHILPNFRAYERFHFQVGSQRIYDTVILFLAEARNAEVRIEPREHSGFAWFLYPDAISTVGKKYADVTRVLRQAKSFLEERRRAHSPAPTHGPHPNVQHRPHPPQPTHR